MTGGGRPFVSIVIPTYRRPGALDRCLASLAAQRYPGGTFEVIVVDDDDGKDGIADLVARHRLDATVLAAPHAGPAAARNRGVAAARGEVLAFIDDDCTADEQWLASLVGRLSEFPDAAVGGRVANGVPGNPYVRASQTLLTFLYRYYHEERRGRLPFFTTNNLGVRASVFARVGGFDETFPFAASEDREWSDRCRHRGHPLVYAPGALVYHAPHLTLAGFARQHFRYGEGAWRFRGVRARERRPGGVEAVRFYTGILGAPFTTGDPQPLRQSGLLFLSQAVGAAGFAYAAARSVAGARAAVRAR